MARSTIYEKVGMAICLAGTGFLIAFLVLQRAWRFELGKWMCLASLTLYWRARAVRRFRHKPESPPN